MVATKKKTKFVSKSDLCRKYGVSYSTLCHWVKMFIDEYPNAPFTIEQYLRIRNLPPKWAEFIFDILGE